MPRKAPAGALCLDMRTVQAKVVTPDHEIHQEEKAKCLLPAEECIAKWGTLAEAKDQKVVVVYDGMTVIGTLADAIHRTGESAQRIGILLNREWVKAFGLSETQAFDVHWDWVDV